MREILFRGKRVDNGEWVYGFYNRCEARLTYTEEHYKNNPRSWIQTIENEGFAGQLVHVDTDTVGQYTGLTDKNGNRVYENDILHNEQGYVYSGEYTFRVVFDGGMFYGESNVVNIMPEKFAYCEVIGNIHDNPNMLTDKGEG